MTPPASVDCNVFAMTDEEIRTLGIEELPQTMGEALEAFEGSTFAREVLGDHIYTKYLEAKSAEWKKFRAEVTDWKCRNTCTSSSGAVFRSSLISKPGGERFGKYYCGIF